MKNLSVLVTVLGLAHTAVADTQTFVTTATDGVTVHGELYTAAGVGKHAPLILLFHQGASNGRAEYEPLAPRLLERGYNLVSIDQRDGSRYVADG